MKVNAKVKGEELEEALKKVNEEFKGNIAFHNDTDFKKRKFRLTVKDSKKKGSSFNPISGRRIKAACWHVHGRFFEELFEINEEAIIYSMGRRITKSGNIWVNYRRGMCTRASDWCHCNEE